MTDDWQYTEEHVDPEALASLNKILRLDVPDGYEIPHTELVVPTTGEIVDAGDPEACLRALSEVRELESRLKELKAELTDALAREFSRQGTKTMELGGYKAELRGGTQVVWDVEVLEELRDLGLPDDRMNALVTPEVTYRVNASVAKQIAAANTSYAGVITRAKTEVPKASYVTLKEGK